MPRNTTDDPSTVAIQKGHSGLLIGRDDGTLGDIDAIEDRLTVSGEWIQSDLTVAVVR